ncbi:MAG: peptidoglycan recognition protein [Actinomycetota bacterium]
MGVVKPKTFRRLSTILPLIVVSMLVPILRPEIKPHTRHWRLDLRSTTTKAPGEFGLVGLEVPGRAPVGPVTIRTSADGKRWTSPAVVEFEADVGPDLDSHETGARTSMPIWTGMQRYVDVDFAKGRPAGTKVHLIDPGPDPSAPLPAAGASPAKPGMITRAGWGADESIRKGTPAYAEPVRLAIVHHTATADSYAKSESDNIVRSIYAYHVKTNGWDDIGYNFLVDRYGQVFEGRFGGVDRTVIGAHSLGFNTNSSGIAIIGNFASSKPPEIAMNSLKRITSWKLDLGTVDPASSLTYVSNGSNKYKKGEKVKLKAVSGHLNVGKTACPGSPIYNALPSVRTNARKDGLPKLFNARVSQPSITPNSDGIAGGSRLYGTLSSSLSWKVEVIDWAGNVFHTVTGFGTSISVPWYGKDADGLPVRHGPYRFKITGKGSAGTLRSYYVGVNVWKWANGTFFQAQPSRRTYILDGGKLRRPSSWQSRASRYDADELVTVSDSITKAYAVGSTIGFREGVVARDGAQHYVISDGKKRPTTRSVLSAKGYNLDSIIDSGPTTLAPHATGATLAASGGYPNGAALYSSFESEAWMKSGIARPFFNSKVRGSYKIRSIDRAGPADEVITAGSTSPVIGLRDGTLVRVTDTTTIYMISDGKRRAFPSSTTFSRMGFKAENILSVTPAELALHEEGASL